MLPDEWLTLAARLAVAALGGLAVGIERQWSVVHRRPGPHFAGVRTFILLALLGALSALLSEAGLWVAGAVLVVSAAALTVLGYAATARGPDVGGTTEVAGLLVLAGGLFAGHGHLRLASGIVSQVDPEPASRIMVDASVSYGSSGGGVYEASTGRLVGLVEGYGTASVPLEEHSAPRSIDVPVPGETYVTSLVGIRRFLTEAGYPDLLRDRRV